MTIQPVLGALLGACLGFANLASQADAAGISLLSGSYTSPDATAQQAAICPTGIGYPAEFGWWRGRVSLPVSATGGQPRIDQVRQNQVIASYTSFADKPGCTYAGDGTDHTNPGPAAASGCGPFTREYSFRLWEPGDVFMVYPAVYKGQANNPWIGPEPDSYAGYAAGIFHSPDGVTIQGVVQNNTRPVIVLDGPAANNTLGQAPVYLDSSNGFTIDSVNVTAGMSGTAGKAGIYDVGASNLTLSNMRVSNFAYTAANGVFGAGNYSGTLTLTAMELDHNGGSNGPAHNAYIGASQIDPNFTVVMTRSWTHDAYYGHLFKSRAQNGIFTANFFQGRPPYGTNSQAEAYLLDIPNGGRVSVRNNVFVKTASGPDSNGMSFTYLMEGTSDTRPQSVDLENNTFVTFARTYDGTHLNYPMSFFYPNVRPDSASWPASIPTRIIKNAFVGYCPPDDGSPPDYRGDISVIESFSELSRAFDLQIKVDADDAALSGIYQDYIPELGTPAYTNIYGAQLFRQQTTIGAED